MTRDPHNRQRPHHDIERAHRRHRSSRHPHLAAPDRHARTRSLSWLSL